MGHWSINQHVKRKFLNLLFCIQLIGMLNRFNITVPGKRILLSAMLIAVLFSVFSSNTYSQWFYTIEAKAGRGGDIDPSGKVLCMAQHRQNI